MTALVVLYTLTSGIGGYGGGSFYARYGGKHCKRRSVPMLCAMTPRMDVMLDQLLSLSSSLPCVQSLIVLQGFALLSSPHYCCPASTLASWWP